jgi:hypothetical protein
VLVTALIAVASVVTPTVVPTVVPTALMHQNKAIDIAATVWAKRRVKCFTAFTPFLITQGTEASLKTRLTRNEFCMMLF